MDGCVCEAYSVTCYIQGSPRRLFTRKKSWERRHLFPTHGRTAGPTLLEDRRVSFVSFLFRPFYSKKRGEKKRGQQQKDETWFNRKLKLFPVNKYKNWGVQQNEWDKASYYISMQHPLPTTTTTTKKWVVDFDRKQHLVHSYWWTTNTTMLTLYEWPLATQFRSIGNRTTDAVLPF